MFFINNLNRKICSSNKRKQNFEAEQNHVFQIFSKYPHPGELEGCPHCIGNRVINPLNEEDLELYLNKAFNLLGGYEDFKYYLPYLLQLVYINRKGESFIFVEKVLKVKWLPEETEAIIHWFIAYLQFKYFGDFENQVQNLRTETQNWLNETPSSESFYFYLPFPDFLGCQDEIRSLLPVSTIEEFSILLDLWPQNELDLITFSLLLTTSSDGQYLYVASESKEIFPSNKVWLWFLDIEARLEEMFWKTSNSRLQQLLSDALQAIINIKKGYQYL